MTLDVLGVVHEECGEDVEAAIRDGGCRRLDYLREFGHGMGITAEDEGPLASDEVEDDDPESDEAAAWLASLADEEDLRDAA